MKAAASSDQRRGLIKGGRAGAHRRSGLRSATAEDLRRRMSVTRLQRRDGRTGLVTLRVQAAVSTLSLGYASLG